MFVFIRSILLILVVVVAALALKGVMVLLVDSKLSAEMVVGISIISGLIITVLGVKLIDRIK